MTAESLASLQARIGYAFDDETLLVRALTHSSMRMADAEVKDLERLEFLGDRVLGLLTAEALWRRFPDMREGDLAVRFNKLVRKETCADAARAWRLDEALRLNPNEEQSGGRRKDAILADACEALLGALYIDGGLPAAKTAWSVFWDKNLAGLVEQARDAKTELQEWSQARGLGTPSYKILERDGPDHRPRFRIEVTVKGEERAIGEGSSKRAAEQEAAEAFLIRAGVWKGETS